jgi:probable F420-dependent oxidoreductase
MPTVDVGLMVFPTDQSIGVIEIAREAEARGFESLWFPEHTHIPTSRRTPFPGGEPIPEHYRRTLDPFVALGAAAAVTDRLRLGTGICLVAQRDPIVLAKEVASIDHLSHGRFLFGIGVGWNVDEMEHHGVLPNRRRDVVRDKVLAMKSLWTEEEGSYKGEFVELAPSWSWPKPDRQPHPPVIMGGAGGPVTFRHVVEYCDGWMPIHGRREIFPKLDLLREMAERAGRDPATIELGVFGAPPRPDILGDYAEHGFRRVVLGLPQDGAEPVLATLDSYAPIVEELS